MTISRIHRAAVGREDHRNALTIRSVPPDRLTFWTDSASCNHPPLFELGGVTPELSNELRLFIARHIGTVGQLEVLLLLYRHPERPWKPSDITRELRGTREATTRWLEMWRVLGFVVVENDLFRFQPSSTELHRCVESLALAYQTRPGAVIERIHSRPNRFLPLDPPLRSG